MLRLISLVAFLVAGNLGAQTSYTLPFRPLDAEYSVPLNRIVMISSSPHQLQIYDPATQGNVAVNLPAAPLDLALSPNGLYAAVAHDGSVSYVNLANGMMERIYPVGERVAGLVAGSRFLYLQVGGSYTSVFRTLDLLSGTLLLATGGDIPLSGARLHPRGDAIYYRDRSSSSSVRRLSLQDGGLPAANPVDVWGQLAGCGGLWISPDGESLFDGCRSVLGLSAAAPTEVTFRGALPDVSGVQGLWVLGGRDELAVVPRASQPASSNSVPGPEDTEVRLFRKGTLRPVGRLALDRVLLNGTNHPVRGRWVFANGGSEVYVIAQTEATAGLAQDFSLRVFDLAGSAPCSPEVSATTVSAPGEGGIVTVNVTGGASCVYRSETGAAWLQMASETVRYGVGEARVIVRPNPGGARTGTVTIGGRVVTVNQSTKPAPVPNPLPLGYELQGAAYSRSQERLLVLSREPAELHILNALTNEERVVALRQRGLTVEVDATGNTAAVGHEGWVTLVDLGSGTVTREYPVGTDAQGIVWGGNGYLYLFGDLSRQPALNLRLSDGLWTKAPTESTGCKNGRRQPGTQVLLLCGKRWSMAGGELTQEGINLSLSSSLYWLFEPGDRLVTEWGDVRRLTANPADDGSLVTQLAPGFGLAWAEHSLPRRTLAVVGPVESQNVSATQNQEVRLYGDDQLGLVGRQQFPSGVLGRYVFWNQSGAALFALGTNATWGAARVMVAGPAANAAGCTAAFAATTTTVGTGEIYSSAAVTVGSGCAWTATSSASWLRVLSGGFGIGATSLSYAVEANRLAVARTATITLSGGATLTVTQSAAPVAVEPVTVTIGAAGGARSFAVTTAAPGTAWTATATVPWVTFVGGAAGTGNGTVNYTVAANLGAARSGLIQVNAANFSILQEAGSSTVIPNSAPSVVSASGSWNGENVVVFRDPNGANDLGVVNVLINRALDGRAACYIAYNAAIEQFYLVDDAGTGLFTLAASPTAAVENGQCRIARSSLSVTREADRLTLRFTPVFKGSFGGGAVYAAARDRLEANSGWQAVNVLRSSSQQGVLGSYATYPAPTTVAAGNSANLYVTFWNTDETAAGALTTMQILINSALDANGACYIGIDRAAMRAYLVTDDGQGLLPGGVALDTASVARGTTQNSRCVLSGTGSSLTANPWSSRIDLTLQVQFKSGFTGNKLIYTGVQAAGAGRNSGWEVLRALKVE